MLRLVALLYKSLALASGAAVVLHAPRRVARGAIYAARGGARRRLHVRGSGGGGPRAEEICDPVDPAAEAPKRAPRKAKGTPLEEPRSAPR